MVWPPSNGTQVTLKPASASTWRRRSLAANGSSASSRPWDSSTAGLRRACFMRSRHTGSAMNVPDSEASLSTGGSAASATSVASMPPCENPATTSTCGR